MYILQRKTANKPTNMHISGKIRDNFASTILFPFLDDAAAESSSTQQEDDSLDMCSPWPGLHRYSVISIRALFRRGIAIVQQQKNENFILMANKNILVMAGIKVTSLK